MVYLLHFATPYPAGRRPQHYLGHARDDGLERRIEEHQAGGTKCRLTAAVVAAGIGIELVRTWPGGFDEEKRLKRRRRPSFYCTVCHP